MLVIRETALGFIEDALNDQNHHYHFIFTKFDPLDAALNIYLQGTLMAGVCVSAYGSVCVCVYTLCLLSDSCITDVFW